MRNIFVLPELPAERTMPRFIDTRGVRSEIFYAVQYARRASSPQSEATLGPVRADAQYVLAFGRLFGIRDDLSRLSDLKAIRIILHYSRKATECEGSNLLRRDWGETVRR